MPDSHKPAMARDSDSRSHRPCRHQAQSHRCRPGDVERQVDAAPREFRCKGIAACLVVCILAFQYRQAAFYGFRHAPYRSSPDTLPEPSNESRLSVVYTRRINVQAIQRCVQVAGTHREDLPADQKGFESIHQDPRRFVGNVVCGCAIQLEQHPAQVRLECGDDIGRDCNRTRLGEHRPNVSRALADLRCRHCPIHRLFHQAACVRLRPQTQVYHARMPRPFAQ
jgi:hypothetical protein